MPTYNVYCTDEESSMISRKAMSPSKVFQVGVACINLGGLDELKHIMKKVKELQENIESKEIWKIEFTQKYASMETERSRLIDALIERGLSLEECKKIYKGE